LAEVERGERGADQVGPACVGEIAGQEGVAAEIDAVDAAEQNAGLPGQWIAPVRPPGVPGCRRGHRRLLGRRRQGSGEDRDQRQRKTPDRERPAPGSVDQGQHERDRHHDRQRFAYEQAVGEDRGAEAHPLRQPLAHERRQRRLRDRDSCAHHDGRGIERERIEDGAAQRGGDARDEKADNQRRHRAQARDEERTRQRRDREQDHRQAGEDADFRAGQAQIRLNRQNHRRHRQDAQPQTHPGEPEQAGGNPKFPHCTPGCDVVRRSCSLFLPLRERKLTLRP
jgi:hypothetical protein